MLHDHSYIEAPWNVVVPVREGRFLAPRKALEPYNVEVHVARLPTFGSLREPVPADELLYVDLQTNSDLHKPGRLGTGRAGFHRGRYLKGVGRTPLAANWNIMIDQKVATGHLAASAAVREFISSQYLRAKGKEALVNSCEGLLLGPLSESLRDFPAYGYDDESAVAPCDATMQGITVKGSVFARFSNFAWLVDHLDLYESSGELRRFLLFFVAYLDPLAPISPSTVTPTRIARAFADAIERTVESFREFWRLGIYWGAPFNNFTMDGRYHDLDTVLFLGAPFLGVLPQRPLGSLRISAHNPSQIFGLEVLTYILYMRLFYRFLIARLSSLSCVEAPLSSLEREFLRETVKAFRAHVGRNHILFSVGRLRRRLLEWIREDTDLTGTGLRQAERLVTLACRRRFGTTAISGDMEVPLRPLSLRSARPGTFRQYAPPHIASFCEIPEEALEEARFMNDLLMKLDGISEPDALLARVEESAALLFRYCGAG